LKLFFGNDRNCSFLKLQISRYKHTEKFVKTMTKTKTALLTIPVLAAIMIGGMFTPAHAGVLCDTIYGDETDNKLIGGDGCQWIQGYGGDDKILAGDGDDFIYPGLGSDRVNAGDGNDTIYMDIDYFADIINCGDGEDTVYFNYLDDLDIFRSCENFIISD
jgi:hypothetical protein